jgi:hypothetical protein
MIHRLPTHPAPGGGLRTWCDQCIRWHYHDSGYGHCVAHCWRADLRYRLSGYQFVSAGEGVG